mgnify:CR=1 FL=1
MSAEGRRTLVIVNPHSANGSTGRRWSGIRSALREAVGEFSERFTERPGHATLLAREGLESGFERIVAVGGDGTNNEVVNGFFERGRAIRPEAELGFIPRGTGGDLRRTLGIGKSLEECLPVLRAGRSRPVDVGLATFFDTEGRETSRHFINITSFGIGGLVDALVNRSSKALGGRLSFMLATVRALFAYRNRSVRLRVDNEFDERIVINNVAVANGQFFGGGMWVAPKARPDDGLFDVVILGDLSRGEVLRGSRRIYRGTHLDLPKVRLLRGRRVVAESDEEVLIDMDGEQPGRLPITCELLPGALRLIAP